MKPLIGYLLLLVLLTDCTPGSSPQPDAGYGYFPLEEGTYTEFLVEETSYAVARPAVRRTYRIRETVGLKSTDATGQDVYPVERSLLTAQGHWQADSLFTTWRSEREAIRVENGQTRVKIQFPVKEGGRWNGNIYNTLAEQVCTLKDVGISKKLGPMTFDTTLTVVEQNDSTLLSLRRAESIYAKGVGLIRQERTQLQYCSTPDCVGKGVIESGYTIIRTIKDYGK